MTTSSLQAAPKPSDRIDPWALSPGIMLDENEVAAATGVSVKTLQNWRSKAIGPRFRRVGGKTVRYRAGAVVEWLDSQEEIGDV